VIRAAGTGILALSLVAGACGGSAASSPTTTTTSSTVPASPVDCAGVDLRARVGVYEVAQQGEISQGVPPMLGDAVASVPEGLFTGVLYGGCDASRVNGLGFEQMVWTNGIGVLSVALQQWPDDGPLTPLPFGGELRQAGIVEVAALDADAAERTRVVHLFDGMKVVTVATYSLTTLSIDRVEELAWAVYDALPVGRLAESDVVARTFDELFAAIPDDVVSVSGLEDAPELSPFTVTMGTAVATRRFIAAGSVVTAYDFGAIGAADRAEAAIAPDGYTIARQPYDVTGTPRFWRWDRIILHYMGDDPELLTRLVEVLGQPFAGAEVGVQES